MIKKEKNYEIPDNIYLVRSAPQLDILKRASLFITHCGMNSTSETVHFGGNIMTKLIKINQKFST